MIVLLLAPSGAFASALESLKLDEADRAILVSAVANDAPDTGAGIRLGAHALPASSGLLSKLERSVIGRNLKRIVPTLDGGHRFASRARRSPEFRAAVARADLIVALERDAVLAGWTGLRRWARPHARGVFGLAPARSLLTSNRVTQSDA